MSALFPVMLDLRGWRCAVFGGGSMAEEKAGLFAGTGAHVVVIAEETTARLQQWAAAGAVEWRRRAPAPEDVTGFRLVISTLADREANAAFAQAAERAGALFNAADDPQHCRFLLPSVHRQGDLVIAVSTSGKCPALAVRIREECARIFDRAYADFLAMAGELRPRIAETVREFSARRSLWYRIVDSPALGLLRAGRSGEARRVAEELIEEAAREEVRS